MHIRARRPHSKHSKIALVMPTLLDHVIITTMKRGSSSSSEDSQPSLKRRKVKYGTFKS